MKIGFIISLTIVLFLCAVGYFGYRGVADSPTPATSPEKLAKLDLPKDLAVVFVSDHPQEDATELYAQAFSFYLEHQEGFYEDKPAPQMVDTLVNLLVSAMECGHVESGFLDKQILFEPGALPEFEDALEMIPGLVLARAQELYTQGQTERAVSVVKAVWALGQRAYEQNVHLYNRSCGLPIMMDAITQLYQWSDRTPQIKVDVIRAWAERLGTIERIFREKNELIINTVYPQIGDLINIAQNDQDIAFRVAAILKLGVVKYNPRSRGNSRVIRRTIQEAKQDANSLIAQAGHTADAFTVEQLRRLR